MFYDICTVFWRDWVVLKRRLPKFILSRMVAPMLYLVAFGWGLGRNIQVGSGSYIDFLVPGIMALNSMNISYNSLTPLCTERVYHRSIGEYIIAPMTPSAFLVGKVLAAVLRGLISSAIIMGLAFAFGATLNITVFYIVVLILNCVIFAEVGFFAALSTDSFEELSQVNTYILLPMSFLCGTFFTTAALPDIIRVFIDILPLTHTSYLLRGIATQSPVAWESVAVLVLYAIIGFILGMKAYNNQLK
ncbi:MAG: multidrug ABC transporter permease [Anaerovibrio sp.]|uniref:ABC transporter permease n=1 Tax=Anaerovibrio sp. TaxID=1872532 RepID=UPI0025C6ACCD|nr:ABC transporter permease [Anaerovibrio sp.]MBE6099085.1 multidrug ABC transporter permease [Anaerovibrio sp.]